MKERYLKFRAAVDADRMLANCGSLLKLELGQTVSCWHASAERALELFSNVAALKIVSFAGAIDELRDTGLDRAVLAAAEAGKPLTLPDITAPVGCLSEQAVSMPPKITMTAMSGVKNRFIMKTDCPASY